MPGSDVPGELSNSVTAILAGRRQKHHFSNNDQTFFFFLKFSFILEMPCVAESLFITDHSSVASHLFMCLNTEVTALEHPGGDKGCWAPWGRPEVK